MIRNVKALGLALMAVFAFSALSASAASAQQGKLTSDGSVTLTGTEVGEAVNNNYFQNGLGKVTCPGSTYTGHRVLTHTQTTEGKTHERLQSGDTTATITPHYATKCFAHIAVLGTRPVTVTPNGCDFVFHIGQTTPAENKEGTYGVVAALVCPPEKDIEVHVYKSGSVEHPAGDSICTITIKPQEGIEGAHLKHTTGAPHDFDLIGTFTNIHEEHTGTLCGTGTSGEAKLATNLTIDGLNSAGGSTEVTITD